VISEDSKSGKPAPLAPELLAAIAQGKSGTIVAEIDGQAWQYAYYPLSTLDWYYVAAGKVGTMMDSKSEPVVTTDPRKPGKKTSGGLPTATARPSVAAVPRPPPDPKDAGAPADAGVADAGVDGGREKKAKQPASYDRYQPPNPFEKWKVYDKKGH
jgi:hypothetical protein